MSFPIKGAEQLTEHLTLHLNRDVLNIISGYISVNFDLPFLTDSLRFFTPFGEEKFVNDPRDDADNDPFPLDFRGHHLKNKDDLVNLFQSHILSTPEDDVDILTLRETDTTVVSKDNLIIEQGRSSVSMKRPVKGFTTLDVFRMLGTFIDVDREGLDGCDNGRHGFWGVELTKGTCAVIEGKRVLTLYIKLEH